MKTFQRASVVLGAQQDKDPKSPTYGGWSPGRVIGSDLHWANAAAKKRCNGDKKLAKPGDLTVVALYRGLDARRANEIRADMRRKKVIAERIVES